MYETIREFFELGSIGATVPTIILSALVVVCWHKPVVKIVQTKVQQWNHNHWFILGVCVGFAGSTIDNGFWELPWTMSYLDHPKTDALIKFGVFPNLPFRQFADSFSAYCHVRSAIKFTDECYVTVQLLNRIVLVSCLMGGLFCLLLFLAKYAG